MYLMIFSAQVAMFLMGMALGQGSELPRKLMSSMHYNVINTLKMWNLNVIPLVIYDCQKIIFVCQKNSMPLIIFSEQ